MKPGNLVKIKRASIGIPKDTFGLLLRKRYHTATPAAAFFQAGQYYESWEVEILGEPRQRFDNLCRRHYLEEDLEVFSESR